MNEIIRGIILVILMIATIICYVFSNSTGLWGFIILGALFELAFWLGLFSNKVSETNEQNNN